MDSLLIKGGTPLHGEVTVSGAKNAVLPILAATLLTAERCVIRRVPRLSDVTFMAQILRSLGAEVTLEANTITVESPKIKGVGDYDLIRKMRGSICILGPLLGRLREASVSLPGGCVIGLRPVDLHLKGLRALGTKIEVRNGNIVAKAPNLHGAEVFLGGRSGPTVLGTANVMMAAVLAEGITIIESAACEPEVTDLALFLNAMGAKITGAGSPTITIQGVTELHGAEHEVIPDRIEAATFAIAAAVTDGEITIKGARAEHLGAVLDKLRAQMMVLMAVTEGTSIITERIFEGRFMHVPELARLGTDIAIEGPSAIVKGGKPLSGAPIMASDLRASAALVIAGMVAEGETVVNRIYHLDRGYENIDEKLRKLGAQIERVAER